MSPADTATFSDSTGGSIGMVITPSAEEMSSSGRPGPSPPSRNAQAPVSGLSENERRPRMVPFARPAGGVRQHAHTGRPQRREDIDVRLADDRQPEGAAHRAAQRLPAVGIRAVAGDDHPCRAARFGHADDGADVAGILDAGGHAEEGFFTAGGRMSASSCRGRAASATTPEGVEAGLIASITGSETCATRQPRPASVVASRRAAPSGAPSTFVVNAAVDIARPAARASCTQVEAVEEHAAAFVRVALRHAAHQEDERVLAAGDGLHGLSLRASRQSRRLECRSTPRLSAGPC